MADCRLASLSRQHCHAYTKVESSGIAGALLSNWERHSRQRWWLIASFRIPYVDNCVIFSPSLNTIRADSLPSFRTIT